MSDKQVCEDIKFLMSFVDYINVEDVPVGLGPMFYITLTQSGDERLASRVREIRERYGLNLESEGVSDG